MKHNESFRNMAGNQDLKRLLAFRRREEMAKAAMESVTMDDGTLVCRGEFGYFSVPKRWIEE